MKAMACILAVLIVILFITGGSSPLEGVASAMGDSQTAALTMKPLSRSEDVQRKQETGHIKLMSYNMHRGIGQDGKLNLDRTAAVIKSSQADIVALQEVERYSIRTGFQDQIKKLSEASGVNYAYGKSLHVLNGEYGNGLLSKYPIQEYEVYELPSYSEQRTVLKAIINIDGYTMAVYNTHLGLKEAERKDQTEYIMQLLSQETFDYVLMGDMNSRSNRLSAFTDKLTDSAQGSEKAEQSTFAEGEVQERIDYIFAAPGLKVLGYDVISSEASDHNPVICEIEIK